MDANNNIEITFVRTKVNRGNYSDETIDRQKELHSKAGAALIYAMHQIQEKHNQTPDKNDDNGDTSKGSTSNKKNTISMAIEVSLDDAIRIADQMANQKDSQAYISRTEVYNSKKRQYGNLSKLDPISRGEAMRALSNAGYSYFKTQAELKLPEQIYLETTSKKSNEKKMTSLKMIRSLARHSICKDNEYPDEEKLKAFILGLVPEERITWLESPTAKEEEEVIDISDEFGEEGETPVSGSGS
jgi:hypothetical protein